MDERVTLEWQLVAKTSEVADDEPLQVRVGDLVIAVFRVGDEFYATDDTCTHEFASLSEGYVDGDVIECPLHQARFHIPTGKVVDLPAEQDLRTYAVKVEGDDIYVGVKKG